MATERQLEKLFWDLRRKYLAKSDECIVMHDIASDMNLLKKYDNLTVAEAEKLFLDAVMATDGSFPGEEMYPMREMLYSWYE